MKYKRVLLKLSGEVFKGEKESGLDGERVLAFARDVKELQDLGCEVGVVIGGGNFWRYRDNETLAFDRVTSDTIGMLATVMNALAFEAALKKVGAKVRALSSLAVPKALESYSPKLAKEYLAAGEILVFAGGTGHPHFTTDSAAALKCLEMECDVLLKGTKVDGVYDSDPQTNAAAQRFEDITFAEVVERKLRVMDLTCASLLMDGNVPMVVFNLHEKGNIKRVVAGESLGTLIHN